MKLTKTQISELLEMIQYENLFFIGSHIGFDFMTPTEIKILKGFGFDLTLSKPDTFEMAFKFGILTMALGDDRVENMNYAKFKDFVLSKKFIPLTKIEQSALESTKNFAYNELKGLGNRYVNNYSQIMIEVDQKQRARYEAAVKKEAEQNIINREGVKELVSRLGTVTQDWSRDLGRMADYIHHDAMDKGRAARIISDYGSDAMVYKDVYDGACKHCISAYTTQGIGSEPKLFKISTLTSNGSNIGRKVIDWKPVVGPHHPWCRCTIDRKPKNMNWDSESKGFTKVDETKIDDRIRGKIKVSIG